jgi:hypothetical protein
MSPPDPTVVFVEKSAYMGIYARLPITVKVLDGEPCNPFFQNSAVRAIARDICI